MAQVFKNPNSQAESIINNPFNIHSVSQQKGKKNPSAFFGFSHRLVNMSPNDYFKFVASQSNTTPEKLMENRQNVANEMTVDDMRSKMREGVKFDTPWLRLLDSGEKGTVSPYWQEGLHRMLAAGQEYGMDTKFPTYIAYENDPWNEIDTLSMDDFIKHYDDTRLSRYNKRKQVELQEQEDDNEYWKKEAASHFKLPVESITQEHIDKYMSYLDKLFSGEWD